MIVLNKNLKYLFEFAPRLTVYDDMLKGKIRTDKSVFRASRYWEEKGRKIGENGNRLRFETDDLLPVPSTCLVLDDEDSDWELIHLDGDYKNCKVENLEPVLFVDEDPMEQLYDEIKSLKEQLITKRDEAKNYKNETDIQDMMIDNLNKQLAYEQGRVKELNKELKKKEQEIRRLFSIIDSKSSN